MSETATDNQVPAGQPGQVGQAAMATTAPNAGAGSLDVTSMESESPATVGTAEGETAREVAAQHFARLLYTPIDTWSRYVFHENDPHPYRHSRQTRARG